jgi:hypothetical protein
MAGLMMPREKIEHLVISQQTRMNWIQSSWEASSNSPQDALVLRTQVIAEEPIFRPTKMYQSGFDQRSAALLFFPGVFWSSRDECSE